MDFLYAKNLTDDTRFFFQLYDKCGVGHVCLEMLLAAGIRWLLTQFGLIANLSLVWITFRNKKKFNGTANRLLALCTFCDFCYLLCYTPPFLLALTGRNFIRLGSCFFLMAVPLFGLFSSILISFFIGLDRLLSILFPMKYRANSASLLWFSVSIVCVYSAYAVSYGYLVTSNNSELPAVCGVSEVYFPTAVQMPLFRNNFLFNLASLLLYLLLWVVLRRELRKSVVTENARATKSIFHAILAIVCTVFSMWLLTSLVYAFTYQITSETVQWFVLPTLSAALSIVAASSNAPLLYLFNTDYRDALRRETKRVCRCLRRIANKTSTNAIHTIGTTNGGGGGGHSLSLQQRQRDANTARHSTVASLQQQQPEPSSNHQ